MIVTGIGKHSASSLHKRRDGDGGGSHDHERRAASRQDDDDRQTMDQRRRPRQAGDNSIRRTLLWSNRAGGSSPRGASPVETEAGGKGQQQVDAGIGGVPNSAKHRPRGSVVVQMSSRANATSSASIQSPLNPGWLALGHSSSSSHEEEEEEEDDDDEHGVGGGGMWRSGARQRHHTMSSVTLGDRNFVSTPKTARYPAQ